MAIPLPPKRAAIAAGAAAAIGIGAFAVLQVARLRPRLSRTKTAGCALVYDIADERGQKVRVMRVGGVYQSATYLGEHRFEPVFEYARALDALLGRMPSAERLLMLGGGGYAWPKSVLTRREDVRMDVVELDPGIIRTARRWFFLDELERLAGPRLRVICGDGLAFLNGAPMSGGERATSYDLIVNDCFSGVEPVRALASVNAARAAKARLRAGGAYAANVVSRDGGADLSFLRDVTATLALVFDRVHVVPCADEEFGGEDNYLVVGTDGALDLPDAVPFDDDFLGEPIGA